ncbi:MAG: ABC transporter permease [Candidatus Caldatribacteriota bacterium]|nr:ABC transporter permease [Candidatus Caldatribacteriota bacterium]
MFGSRPEIIYIIAAITGITILLFNVFPIINTFYWTDSETLIETLFDREVIASIWLSVKCASITTIIAFLLGIPLAYYLARHEFRLKALIESLIDIPMVIPHTVAGICLLTVLSPRSIVGQFLEQNNIETLGTEIGIVIAMLFVSMPLLIDAAKDAFKWVPTRIENVSRSLGANQVQTFFGITFVLSWRGILSGMIITWARAISEFGAVIILAYHPMVAPTLIYERFTTYGMKYAIPANIILISISIIIFIVLRLISLGGKEKHDSRS